MRPRAMSARLRRLEREASRPPSPFAAEIAALEAGCAAELEAINARFAQRQATDEATRAAIREMPDAELVDVFTALADDDRTAAMKKVSRLFAGEPDSSELDRRVARLMAEIENGREHDRAAPGKQDGET